MTHINVQYIAVNFITIIETFISVFLWWQSRGTETCRNNNKIESYL